jgi:cellulose synthase/poly-beta-1,6-N-acetylglucosamine synthase-like glycosyltransferase
MLTILALVLVALTLPGTVELLLLTLASLFHRNARVDKAAAGRLRLAVIIPAHNERLHIARCVESIAASRQDIDAEIIVIADNCVDDTAALARESGARVLERRSDAERGKGYALDFAFETLLPEGFDAFLIVDADSVVQHDFLPVMASLFAQGADAVQCSYTPLNVEASLRTRLMNVSQMAFNVLRPRGRSALGLSAGILGNGFGLSAATLRAVPYTAASVVEDLEYHILLTQSGRRVRFTDRTWVKADMPTGGQGTQTQRARWEGGRFRMIGTHVPGLLKRVLSGKRLLIEPMLDLLLLPLSYHVLLILLTIAVPVGFARIYGLAALALVLIHTLIAIRVGGGNLRDLRTLAIAPFYILWKLTVLRLIGRSARQNASWVRTHREPEDDAHRD